MKEGFSPWGTSFEASNLAFRGDVPQGLKANPLFTMDAALKRRTTRTQPFIEFLSTLLPRLLRTALAHVLQVHDLKIGVGLVASLHLLVLLHLGFVRLGHRHFMTRHGHGVARMFGEVGLAAQFIDLAVLRHQVISAVLMTLL